MPKIEAWDLISRDERLRRAYGMTAPRTGRGVGIPQIYLSGYVTGHVYLEDNRTAYTSQIMRIDLKHCVAYTKSGNVYELGEPRSEDKQNALTREIVKRLRR